MGKNHDRKEFRVRYQGSNQGIDWKERCESNKTSRRRIRHNAKAVCRKALKVL